MVKCMGSGVRLGSIQSLLTYYLCDLRQFPDPSVPQLLLIKQDEDGSRLTRLGEYYALRTTPGAAATAAKSLQSCPTL